MNIHLKKKTFGIRLPLHTFSHGGLSVQLIDWTKQRLSHSSADVPVLIKLILVLSLWPAPHFELHGDHIDQFDSEQLLHNASMSYGFNNASQVIRIINRFAVYYFVYLIITTDSLSFSQGFVSHLVVCWKYTSKKQYFGEISLFKSVRNLAWTPWPHSAEQSDHLPKAVTSQCGSRVTVSSLSILRKHNFGFYYK